MFVHYAINSVTNRAMNQDMSTFIRFKMNYTTQILLVFLVLFNSLFSLSVSANVAASGQIEAVTPKKQNNNSEKIKIVTSIKPIQLLVNDIQGTIHSETHSAKVLLKNNQNHHLVSLKPSQRRQLADADVVFYIDSDFEIFLKKIIRFDKSKRTKYVALGDTLGLRLLSLRSSGEMPHSFHTSSITSSIAPSMENSDKGHSPHVYHEEDGGHGESGVDWHIWLSPDNAIVMLGKIRDVLSDINPNQAMLYQRNFEKISNKLIAYSMQIAQKMKAVMHVPFFTLHDGYQYFEEQYGLQSKGTILRHDENSPSLKHLNEIKQAQQKNNIHIILKEQQFSNRFIDAIADKGKLKVVNLDSLGQNLSNESISYFEFLQVFTNTFYSGLAQRN